MKKISIILILGLFLISGCMTPGYQVVRSLNKALAEDDINLCSSENTKTPGGCYLDFVIEKENDTYCNQIKGTNNDEENIKNCHEQFEYCKNTGNWCGRK